MDTFDPDLTRELAGAPFFDDWSANSEYYKILFRPGVALQARELNQMQTILQNQTGTMASSIYQNGSVVSGCSVQYIPDLEWVAIADQFATNTSLAQDDPSLVGSIAIGNTSGVQAFIVTSISGFAAQNPGKFFVRYTAPGSNGNRTFIAGEYLNVYSTNTAYIEEVVLSCANVQPFVSLVGDVVQCVQTGNTANTLATGVVTKVDSGNNQIFVNNIENFFATGESLILIDSPTINTTINTVAYDTGSLIGSINVLSTGGVPDPYTANSTSTGVILTPNTSFSNADALGYAYGAAVSPGVIYQNGYFVDVNQQTVVVNPANNSPAGFSLGFKTDFSIITQDIDSSLNDNALGYPNYNAPGAYRLHLEANLISVESSSLTGNDSFFPIVKFSQDGVAFQQTDPAYSALGNALAERTYEESGHFIVNPFVVTTNTNPYDDQSVILNIQPGLAYVSGERVQLLGNIQLTERRGVDTESFSDQILTTTYGKSLLVNQMVGSFSQDTSVNLYDTTQKAVTMATLPSGVPQGNVIGTAIVRTILPQSLNQGEPNSQFSMYLFDINMTGNFADVRSIGKQNIGYADSVLNSSNQAVLLDSSYNSLVFDTGSPAVKSLTNANGAQQSSYYYMAQVPATISTAGTISFTAPSGSELGYGVGVATQEERQNIILSVVNTVATSNISTSAQTYANGVISATGIGNSIFYPGDIVGTGAGQYVVSTVLDANTLLTNCTTAASGVAIWRIDQAGHIVNLDGVSRTVSFANSTSGTISLGQTYTAPGSCNVTFYAYRPGATQTGKQYHSKTTVVIDTSNSSPWCLGVPDVVSTGGIYSFSNGSVDFSRDWSQSFVLDNGQRDGFYELASLSPSPTFDSATQNSQFLVLVNHFTANNTSGSGFFTVDSYPVDDSQSADANTTITTSQIPNYISTSGKSYALRNSIDFRPYKQATANVTNNILNATVAPSYSTAFDANTTGMIPYPSGNFLFNFTQYLGRKDLLLLNSSGSFNVKEGNPDSQAPKLPSYDANSNLSIAYLNVPPWPSLATDQLLFYGPSVSNSVIGVQLQNHRRYTMNDISNIDQRVSQLEYYVTLNTLETSALSTTVINNQGLDQFKNGIFADPMNNHAYARTDLPQYQIAIDGLNGYGRPFFHPWFFDLSIDESSLANTQITGTSLTLKYDQKSYVSEPYATDQRVLTGAPPSYIGNLVCIPSVWTDTDVVSPAASIQSDGTPAATALAQMAAPPFCSQYGWWRTNLQSATSSGAVATANTLPTISSSSSSYSVSDNQTVDVSIQPYAMPKTFHIVANGLKPYTTFQSFVDNFDFTNFVAPASQTANGEFSRTDNFGVPLISNSRGQIVAEVAIPQLMIPTGMHSFTLIDENYETINNSNVSVSGAVGAFSIQLTLVIPPPPPPPPAPPPPPPPVVGPTAAYKIAAGTKQSVNSPANPVIYLTDTSVAGTDPLASWTWIWGDGTTSTSSSPGATVSHIYSTMPTNTQSVTVFLTVTDSVGTKSSFSHVFNIARNVAPIPPPAPTFNLSMNAYQAFDIAGVPSAPTTAISYGPIVSDAVTSTGTTGVAFIPISSNNVPGAYWSYTISPVSGLPLHHSSSANTTAGTWFESNYTSSGWANSQTSSNGMCFAFIGNLTANASSTFTVTATYMNSGTSPNPTISSTMQLNSSVVATTSNTGYGGGGCADVTSYTPLGPQIGEYQVGDPISVCRRVDLKSVDRIVSKQFFSLQNCYTLVNADGMSVVISDTTPLEGRNGEIFLPKDAIGKELPAMKGESNPFWSEIKTVEPAGRRLVNRLSISGQDVCYWAGEKDGEYISVHNMTYNHTISKE